jgi:hypothetical protein
MTRPAWFTDHMASNMHSMTVIAGGKLSKKELFWMRYCYMRKVLKSRTEELCKDV